jgi:hypothetical protein
MNENTNPVDNAVETATDAFLEGWDDAPGSTESADPQPAAEKEATPEAAEPATAPADTTAEEAQTEEARPATADAEEASWDLNYMGERRTMTAKEVTPELLQKGLDYDRVRGKYDEAKPVMDMFTQFAKQANMSVSEYVAYIRQQTKMNDGMSEAEAKRAVELEDREAAVAAKEAEQREAQNAQNESQAKVQADLREFAKAFPDIYEKAKGDPKAIPDEVWADVNSGKLSLTAAYSKYAVKQAKAEAEAAAKTAATAKQNEANASRSTGSMKSAGSDTVNKDPFLDGWNSYS